LLCCVNTDAGIYGAVYFACSVLSAVLTNNAAALLMYPIAMGTVDKAGVDRKLMAMTLMLSASDYSTSFGYQTNLMVYGPGGYTNMDFMRLGGSMQVMLWLTTTAMVSSTVEVLYIFWIVSFIGLVLTAIWRLKGPGMFHRRRAGTSKQYDSDDEDDHGDIHENLQGLPGIPVAPSDAPSPVKMSSLFIGDEAEV
jgi:hypothetical protein